REYEQESDSLGQFLAECRDECPGLKVPKSKLWDAYQTWSSEPVTRKDFAQKMKSHGFGEHNNGTTRYWTGLRLKATDTTDATDTSFNNFSNRKILIEETKNVSGSVSVSVVMPETLMPETRCLGAR